MLTAQKLEKAVRRLAAFEQTVETLTAIARLLRGGGLQVGKEVMPLVKSQKDGLSAEFSTRVIKLEAILAGLETEVTGGTAIVPGPAGSGVTDWATADEAIRTLQKPENGVELLTDVWDGIRQARSLERDEDGELTEVGLPVQGLAPLRQTFEKRLAASKLMLAQLRGLGA